MAASACSCARRAASTYLVNAPVDSGAAAAVEPVVAAPPVERPARFMRDSKRCSAAAASAAAAAAGVSAGVNGAGLGAAAAVDASEERQFVCVGKLGWPTCAPKKRRMDASTSAADAGERERGAEGGGLRDGARIEDGTAGAAAISGAAAAAAPPRDDAEAPVDNDDDGATPRTLAGTGIRVPARPSGAPVGGNGDVCAAACGAGGDVGGTGGGARCGGARVVALAARPGAALPPTDVRATAPPRTDAVDAGAGGGAGADTGAGAVAVADAGGFAPRARA
jgi:hypothetical protein